LILKLKSYHESDIDIYTTLIEFGIDIDNNIKRLTNYIKSKKSKLDYKYKNSLEKLLANKEEYKENYEELHKYDKINGALSSLLDISENRRQSKDEDFIDWFNKNWDIVKNLNFDEYYKDWNDYKYFVALVLLLGKINKKEELYSLSYEYIDDYRVIKKYVEILLIKT
jgi:hypothetical protein